ncbi:hypothetical protein SCD_n03040 (plasmid) [Sulfuricella denitrificans skB26]|uniref:Uncharacterized protein n=1 Tax=Sulfuricella denitrificans (strain DSM 22764 / NBRC 105220 / skB26) TaxID=1163617 RepID=S6API3_SULDS|nr:hypothetical protein SCD_n03040 [Sulfuricella denitrificans skB26]
MAIPEGLRIDVQWDEINELEISLAGVNREGEKAIRRKIPGRNGHLSGCAVGPRKKIFRKSVERKTEHRSRMFSWQAKSR